MKNNTKIKNKTNNTNNNFHKTISRCYVPGREFITGYDSPYLDNFRDPNAQILNKKMFYEYMRLDG